MRPSSLIVAMLGVMLLAGCEAPSIEIKAPPIRIEEEQVGSGRIAQKGNLVAIDYEIRLPNGSKVNSASGYRFELGAGTVISGIDEAVNGMRVGGRRVIECPPHRHWGRQGYGDGAVPPNTPLIIDIRLVSIQ